MLLVLASLYDRAARALVERWREYDARLVTCRDLSRAGWRFDPEDARAALVSVGGESVHASEIRGVLTRLPSVTPYELPHIVAEDREYVAAEMTAFLTAWLSSASFPVVNRPTPVCLMGPNWRAEQWTHAALRAGARVRSTTRLLSLRAPRPAPSREASEEDARVGRLNDDASVTLTVACGRCFGTTDEALEAQALRLAELAGVELLEVRFGVGRESAFVGAYLAPDVSHPDVADALLERFLCVGETVCA
jgi:hypothetical protein